MTPEQTLDWLAEQHKSQCNEDRPVQEWIRSMKSMLPAPVQDVPETDFGNMTKEKALDLALEAMERYQVKRQDFDRFADEITAIKQARSAPVQEPSCPECVFGLCHCGLRDTPPAAPVREPDYAWPTIADYEKEVGFAVNDTFKAAWRMARATNDLFKRMVNT
jgi:hypothetical protein